MTLNPERANVFFIFLSFLLFLLITKFGCNSALLTLLLNLLYDTASCAVSRSAFLPLLSEGLAVTHSDVSAAKIPSSSSCISPNLHQAGSDKRGKK